MVSRWLRFGFLVGFSTGCADAGPESRARTTVEVDAARLCLLPRNESVAIFALSTACGCETLTSATCSAQTTGERIVVSSTVAITDSGGEICPAGCETRSTRCRSEGSARGDVDILQGTEQADVYIPLAHATPLFGDHTRADCEDLARSLEATSLTP